MKRGVRFCESSSEPVWNFRWGEFYLTHSSNLTLLFLKNNHLPSNKKIRFKMPFYYSKIYELFSIFFWIFSPNSKFFSCTDVHEKNINIPNLHSFLCCWIANLNIRMLLFIDFALPDLLCYLPLLYFSTLLTIFK